MTSIVATRKNTVNEMIRIANTSFIGLLGHPTAQIPTSAIKIRKIPNILIIVIIGFISYPKYSLVSLVLTNMTRNHNPNHS